MVFGFLKNFMWYASLGMYDVAVKHTMKILACSHQSKATQELFFSDFLQTVKVGEYQGAYKGLLEKYGPERAGFTGIGVGAAYYGVRVELDYIAIDHIINSATKSNYMSAGQISVPIVFRGPNGAAVGVEFCSGYNLLSIACYASCPRLKVLSPYSLYDGDEDEDDIEDYS
ncbi:hypothetical protein Ahy_B03g065905 [Arachis hypogaea]|uniref:Pyruvate dehydrogenase E1 component subunit beta n=1 Tax=Arachis hypogaea TaxID=3818 RepID=A0A445A2Q6_ARAHY|nr:hypothetical protein Ahy_B03g065905 [Arachis hypogaea]